MNTAQGTLSGKSTGVQLLMVFVLLLASFLVFMTITGVVGLLAAQVGLPLADSNDRNMLLATQALSSLCVFGLTAWLSAWLLGTEPVTDYLRFERIDLRWLLLGLGIYLLSMPMTGILAQLNESLKLPAALATLEELLRQMEEAAKTVTEQLTSGSGWGLFIVELLVIAVIPGLVEELLFRGVVQNLLQRGGVNGHAAVWLSAALFSFIHFQFFGFAPRLFMGAVLGYLFWYSRSIWTNIAAHSMNNALALVAMWATASDPDGWVAATDQTDCLTPAYLAFGAAACALGVWMLLRMKKAAVKAA